MHNLDILYFLSIYPIYAFPRLARVVFTLVIWLLLLSDTRLILAVRDMDANTLFENHSVDEVREIEKKVRHDIEWKKEEMRDLVGLVTCISFH